MKDSVERFRASVAALVESLQAVKEDPPSVDDFKSWALLGMFSSDCWKVSQELHRLALESVAQAPEGEGYTGGCGHSP